VVPAQHGVAVLQPWGSLGSAGKGAAPAWWLRGCIPCPMPGGLPGGSFPQPLAGQPLPSTESSSAPLPRTVLFGKPLVLGFSACLRVGFIHIYDHVILFKENFFSREGKLSGAASSAGCDRIRCLGYGGGWPGTPATGPWRREKVARLGSGSEIQLLVPQPLPPWGWDVDEGWLAAFPPVGRAMFPE